MREITGRQKEILDFVDKFIRENVYSPTIREIGDHFQMSPKSAHDIVVALKRKGFLKSKNGKPRTLTVIQKGQV